MTSFKQLEANRRNAEKSTGPKSVEGKQRSRCNAIRHGLTAETVIASLENVDDYKDFEAAITADYDAKSAVERELILRLASLLWRLRRATAIESGLFGIHADDPRDLSRVNRIQGNSGILSTISVPAIADHSCHRSQTATNGTETVASSHRETDDPAIYVARCFLRLANMPACEFDRLSRYEALLWRQAGQILFALDALDRRKPQERRGHFHLIARRRLPRSEDEKS
jgi:hypothetical protein